MKLLSRALPRAAGALLFGLLAGGCRDGSVSDDTVLETVELRPTRMLVETEGRLRATRATPLLVPGENWNQRQLLWMAEDGSRVEAGAVVARFGAPQSELELDKALLDLARGLLAKDGVAARLSGERGRLDVDLADVEGQLAIARRYEGADLAMFARNEVLDALEDVEFLGEKRRVIDWRLQRSLLLARAEQAVLDNQRATHELNAQRRRGDLDALELRAPNAGVLVLSANWSGEKPRLGGQMWAGNEFASLPDPSALELEISLPQNEAAGIGVGAAVEFHPLGRPELAVRSQLHWVAGSAQQRNRQSPVKYLQMRAEVPVEVAAENGWVPGMGFAVRLRLLDAEAAITLPNVALQVEGAQAFVQVAKPDGLERRAVELGQRGPVRSQVVAGLAPGERVLLTATAEASR